MKYCKGITGDYIDYIGTGDTVGIEITEEEYNDILSAIENKPEDTETHYYMLRADTLEYEAVQRPEPITLETDPYTACYDQAVLDMIESGVL